jgi:hypothetical protein
MGPSLLKLFAISCVSDYDVMGGYLDNNWAGRIIPCLIPTVETRISNCSRPTPKDCRISTRNRRHDEDSGSAKKDEVVDSMTPREKFRTSVFLVAVDCLLSALQKRLNAYSAMSQRFGFLRSLQLLSQQELQQKANQLVSAYPDDLEPDLCDELQHFRGMFQEPCVKEGDMYQFIIKHDLCSCFPNVTIVLRMYLSVMVSNCTGERSFSRLKRIKDALRNSMGQERLNSLALMCIEHELTNELSFDTVMDEFAFRKARKVTL